MLYLNPPYFVINGVSVFPDHADPLQFYFLPMMPHLTMVTDPATKVSTPQIQLIEYEGSAGTGGFIDFDVNIGIDPAALSEVANQIERQLNLATTPRLSPVTFTDGSVRLLILGAQSADPGLAAGHSGSGASGGTATATASPATQTVVAPAASGPQFVVKVENAAKPALYGDNQATFSVQLDQYGATIMEQALQGQLAPIAVIYSLQFLALRPAFHVHLTADWHRVQTYLDTQYSAGVLFFSSDIEKSVDKLIEDKVINIQVDTFVTEPDLGTGGTSDRDRAVAECYELVKTNFFQSSLAPPNPNAPDDWSRALQTFDNVSDIAMTGGAAAAACFSYKSVDITRIDQKSLNFDVSERAAVLRTIYPQGHLSGLLSQLTKQGLSLSQFIVRVDLDNPFFQRRKVAVLSYADFQNDSIASIDVNLTYNGIVQSVALTSSGAATSVDWSSLLQNGQMVRPVSYSYTVNFKNVDTTQRPGKLTSATQSVVGDVLDIEPRDDLYGVTVVPIRAFGFPWDRYPSVEVQCRYVDAPNGINLQPSAVLTNQNQEVDWSMFMSNAAARSFDYRLTYSLAGGGTAVSPWKTTGDGKIDIVDPFPTKISLTVLAALDWAAFAEALVFVAYPSKAAPVAQQSFTLNQANPTAPPFQVDRQNPTQNDIYYEARLVRTNGQVWTIPGSITSDQYLILQDGMKGHQIVTIVPQQVDFAASQIQQISVSLRYVDPANSLNESETVTISNPSDVRSFAYDYLNGQIAPQYRADIELANGQTKSIDWTQISDTTVTIRLDNLN
ncbi:MAG TPA: hypothetical protein VIW73_09130 [Candidatus Cybelea sp.]